MSTTIDRYRRWYDYEKDAHDKVARSLETVPIENRSGPEYRKAVTLLGHIVGCREIWLSRLGAIPKPTDPLFFEEAGISDILTGLRRVEDQWTAYLNQLTDADLERVFEYQSYDSGRFRNRVEDILTQMFGHSWYHRGQIAMLVRAAGGEPAATDLVFWCREPVGK